MSSYRVTARNYATQAENRIHSDAVAQQMGFTGALVPGVAVFGYMAKPLIDRFGADWLNQTDAGIRFLKPAYDGDDLVIEAGPAEDGDTLVRCHNGHGELLAELYSRSSDEPAAPAQLPQPTLDADGSRDYNRVEMCWETVVPERPFTDWLLEFSADTNGTYRDQVNDTSELYRDLVHPHWLLAVANRALTREYIMPAWIHVGSELRLRERLHVGDRVRIRTVPLEKWRRKGYEFIRLQVCLIRGDRVTTEIFHTAIFNIRS